jgi:hypothetical protein
MSKLRYKVNLSLEYFQKPPFHVANVTQRVTLRGDDACLGARYCIERWRFSKEKTTQSKAERCRYPSTPCSVKRGRTCLLSRASIGLVTIISGALQSALHMHDACTLVPRYLIRSAMNRSEWIVDIETSLSDLFPFNTLVDFSYVVKFVGLVSLSAHHVSCNEN